MAVICAWVMLISAAPSVAPRRSAGAWKVSLPILITAICWPLVPVLSLVIAPMVAPVLSFTGSPTLRAGAAAALPAVALVSAAEPDGAVVDEPAGGAVLASGVEDGAVDCIGAPVDGMLDELE